jgi:PAS domain S-box-containing protein
VLEGRLPLALAWGPRLLLFYNDAFRGLLGESPPAPGQPLHDAWGEVRWHAERALFEGVMARGETHRSDGQRLAGRSLALCYAPVRGESGDVCGVWVTALEHAAQPGSVSALRSSEQALRLSEERLELAVRSARLGVWDWDVRANTLLWNDRMLELYGLTREQFSGDVSAWENGIHPGDRARAIAEMQATLRGERTWDTGFRVQAPDGTVRHVKADGVVLRDEQGVALRVLGLNRDVTEAHEAEANLKQSERRYRALFDHMQEALAYCQMIFEDGRPADFIYLVVNGAFVAKTGLRDVVGKRVSEVLPGIQESDPQLFELFARVARTAASERTEVYVKAMDAWFSVSVYCPEPGHFVSVFENITEAKRTAETLRKTQRILEEGQRIAHVGSFEYVVDTKTTSLSAEAYRIYGLDPGGPPPGDEDLFIRSLHPEDRARVHAAFEAAVRGGVVFEQVHRILRPDGRVRWVKVRALPHFDGAGALVRYVGATLDITDARRAEDALREAARTEAEASALREADRRKDDFLAMLGHELRNPLAPIRNSLYILDRVPNGGEQAVRARAIIQRQVEHLARLVDDLLDVSRITRGKVVLRRERLELGELVRRTAEDYRGAFAEAEVALEVRTGPGEAWVDGDPTRLSQVVGNLLTNAARFTPRGGKSTLSVLQPAPGGQALVRVEDTGYGIDPRLLPRLFQPFTQAELPLDRKKGGLGLGLALVKGLVEMHGGTVDAASPGPGRGATFTVRLPLAPAAHPGPGHLDRPAQVSPRRVLVVEDNVDAATSLAELLALDGHEVKVALTGREGIEQARALRPDVVLCDIGLPEMDGYGVARALRADPGLSGVRLVALTGYAGPGDVARARAAGFDAHLGKPPSLEALERELRGP